MWARQRQADPRVTYVAGPDRAQSTSRRAVDGPKAADASNICDGSGATTGNVKTCLSMFVSAPPCGRPQSKPAEVKPLALERYKIQFTVSRETHDKLRRAQDLLRHIVPNGDPAMIFERALGLLLEDLERTRIGKTAHSRATRGTKADSRHIPAAVKRAVWQRHNGRCAFTGPHGRCTETGFLEYHHVVAFASGGKTSASNIELRCRAHNQYEAELWFGAVRGPTAREARAFFGV